MRPDLSQHFKEVAQVLHARFRDEFAYLGERWWMVTRTQDGTYGWTKTDAREVLLHRIGELVAVIPDSLEFHRIRHHLETRWGQNQITGYASTLFRTTMLPIRKAPDPQPEPQAPEAEPQPAQPDH